MHHRAVHIDSVQGLQLFNVRNKRAREKPNQIIHEPVKMIRGANRWKSTSNMPWGLCCAGNNSFAQRKIMLCQHVVREEHVNKKEASGAPQFSSRPEANTNTRCRCDKCQGRNQRSHHRQDTHEREQQTGGQLLIPMSSSNQRQRAMRIVASTARKPSTTYVCIAVCPIRHTIMANHRRYR